MSASKKIYNSFLENLASQGYIVAAIDHTYFTFATVFPDRHVTLFKLGYKYFNTSAMIDYCNIVSEDMRFIINKFEQIGLGKKDNIFKDRIDTNKIGVFGHSFGGSASYNLCFTDKRVKAGIDIDGTTAFLPGSSKVNAPFLMIVTPEHTDTIKDSKLPLYKDIDLSYKKYLEKEKVSEEVFNEDTILKRKLYVDLKNTIARNGLLITIKGTKHMNFSDTGLYFPLVAKILGLTGDIDPEKAIEITNSCTLDFFDKYLKNKSGAALESSRNKYKETVLERLSN